MRRRFCFYLSMVAIISILNSCCGWVIYGDTTLFRCRILNISPSDTVNISIYGDNLIYVPKSGKFIGYSAQLDSNGYFLVTGTTPSQNECSSTDAYWQNGPYLISISGTNIQNYIDTISVSELQSLPKLSADILGIKLGSQEIGIWELPDINLRPK